MWLDITECWTLSIILYGGLTFLQGASGLCENCVRNVTRSARPNADVLLPCAFPASPPGRAADGDNAKVLWTQSSTGALLKITQTGRINFSDPREGRVKVFPNLCRLGNFSIRIEHLQQSDLGQYCCVLHNRSVCSVVEFSTDNEGGQNEVAHFMVYKWFIIGGGIGGVVCVLLIICFCCAKFRKRGDSAPDHTSTSVHEGSDSEEIVYENDEHDPKSVACVEIQHQEEVSSRSTTQQPLPGKPFYVNQQEISKHLEKMEKKKKKKKKKSLSLQYENPIYANSTQELDQI